MRVLGIIPARGGSKGVPRKNIKLLCGKPLIAYTIEAAMNAKRLTRTIVSTEDEEIAEVAKSLGADVPFMRPKELADDATPTFDVVIDSVKKLEDSGEEYDAICLLQPTNPLRRSLDIDECVDMLEKTGADSVVTVLPVPDKYNPKWVYWKTESGEMSLSTGETEPTTRRQDLPSAFHREGSVYVTRVAVLKKRRNLYGDHVLGYEMKVQDSVNIDTVEDWENAELQISMAPRTFTSQSR